ncbi:unnamed protein product, partial [Penicillium salamii]
PTNCLGITMSPRSASGWPEWEEKNLLWLDAHQELSWKARSDAYYEQHRVARSAESLRGKKYHILRKCRRAGARASDRSVDQNNQKQFVPRSAVRLHWRLSQTRFPSRVTLTNGLKQSSRPRRARPTVMDQVKQKSPD